MLLLFYAGGVATTSSSDMSEFSVPPDDFVLTRAFKAALRDFTDDLISRRSSSICFSRPNADSLARSNDRRASFNFAITVLSLLLRLIRLVRSAPGVGIYPGMREIADLGDKRKVVPAESC